MNVTLKDKKDIIYNEYIKSLNKIKELENGKVNIQTEAKKKTETKALDTCKEVIGLGILNGEIVGKFNSVTEAIEIKEKELDELYAIEKEAQTLIALKNANIDKTKENEEKCKELEAVYTKKTKDLENAYKEMEKELQSKYSVKEKELKNALLEKELDQAKLRQRNEEEYKYSLEREREKQNNEWNDLKEKREKELELKENELKEKEANISMLEDQINDLKDIVEDIPNKIEKAKKEAENITKNKLTNKHDSEKEIIQKEAQWEKDKAKEKIEDLEERLNKSTIKIAALEESLMNAYGEMREMATEAVKSSGLRVIEHAKSDK